MTTSDQNPARQTNVPSGSLAPCPFCGVELYACTYDGGKTRHAHEVNGCVLDRKFVQGEAQEAAWNIRSPAPQEQPAAQVLGVDLAKDGTETHCEGLWKDGVLHITNVRTIPPQAHLPVDAPIVFGLEAQGHIPAVEAALSEGADWQEIGRRIGWDGETAKTYYERHLARKATTEGQPDGR